MISVIGHFGKNKTLLNGQTVKTKIITEALREYFGNDSVVTYDTHGGVKTLLKAPFQVYSAMKNSSDVIIFPAHNGLRIYAPLLVFIKNVFKDRQIYYVVIGGWLPKFLKNKACLAKSLKQFDGIYVETNTMKSALEPMGFSNIYVMPNCKKLPILSADELVYPVGIPYRLCTFSRVMKEKGIETAVNMIVKVNKELGYIAYSLDIYGQIDSNQMEWFERLQKRFPQYVHYCGTVDADKSVDVLKDYFALLFPTHFYTEGIPGTIIDAFAAGIPVISAKWESYSDIVDEDVTGISYEFDNQNEFKNVLIGIAHDPQKILDMKENCINKAKDYIPETATKVLAEKIKGIRHLLIEGTSDCK